MERTVYTYILQNSPDLCPQKIARALFYRFYRFHPKFITQLNKEVIL